MKKKESAIEHVMWDDQQDDPIHHIKTALRRMGIHVYNDPVLRDDGSTCKGLIISKRQRTRRDIRFGARLMEKLRLGK